MLNNWNIAYVTDGSNVFQTTNAGASWTNITGNLSDNNIHTVNVVDGTGGMRALAPFWSVKPMASSASCPAMKRLDEIRI